MLFTWNDGVLEYWVVKLNIDSFRLNIGIGNSQLSIINSHLIKPITPLLH